MKKATWRKKMVGLMTKVGERAGETVKGSTLRFYRDKDLSTIVGCKSYDEAWELVKPLRDAVGM